MKKLLFLSMAGFLTLCACGGKSADVKTAAEVTLPPAEALLASAEYTEAGLKGMFKTPGKATADEFEALMMAIEKCEYQTADDKYIYDDCAAVKAFNSLFETGSTEVEPVTRQKKLGKLLSSRNPAARDFAFSKIGIDTVSGKYQVPEGKSVTNVNKQIVAPVLAAAKKEKDPIIQSNIIGRLAQNWGEENSPDVNNFILESAKNENPVIRRAVPKNINPKYSKSYEGVPDMILTLCLEDADEIVRNDACGQLLNYDVQDGMQLAKNILNTPEQAASHDGLAKSLCNMWYNYPTFDANNADAYKAWMQYIKTTPRTAGVPAASAVSEMSQIAEGEAFTEWKKNAKYYKPADIVKALSAIVKDTAASYDVRANSITAIANHGKASDLKALRSKLEKDAKPDDAQDAKKLLEKLDSEIAKVSGNK